MILITNQKIKIGVIFIVTWLILLFNQAWGQSNPDSNHIKSDTIKNLPDTVAIKSSSNPINLVISEDKSSDLLTGVLIPIGTFFLGYLINYLIGFFSKRNELTRTYRRWKAEINSLRSPMTNQVEAFKRFIASQNDEEYTIPDPAIFTGLACESFKTLDKGEFLRAVQINLNGYKGDEKLKEALRICNSTLGYIEIISSTHSMFLKKLDEFLNDSGELSKEFNENYRQLFLAFRNMGIELEGKTPDGKANSIPEYHQMVILMHRYLGSDDSSSNDIFELERNLFMELDPLITSLRTYDSCHLLYEFNHACITNIRLIRQEREYLNHHINIAINKYEALLSELDDVVSLSPKAK